MPLYTAESLETLRRRVDLVEVVSPHVDMKRAGAAFKACCPFHDEKTPSFTIQKGDSHYHCFGCGAHGDAIQFLMDHARMNFQEAIENLAQRFGVILEIVEGEKEQRGPRKAEIKRALLEANRLFHFLLLHTEEGGAALRYLYDRGLTLEFIERFYLGLAPRQGGVVRPALHAKGFTDEVLYAAGLLREREDGSSREFFYDRITFPICDGTGAVIGFSARKYREETFGGKYINSSETTLFKKSRVIYGLHECRRRIAKEAQAIIVEGQIDALSLIFNGLNIAVAALGTAFGEGHVNELVDLGVKRVFLALDADKAGIEAARKVGDLFQKRGIEVKVIRLPIGSDPDALIRSDGMEGFIRLLENAQEYLAFLIEVGSLTYDLNSPAGKSQLLQEVVERIRQWNNPVMVHESLRRLAHLMRVPEEMVNASQMSGGHYLIRKSASAGLLDIDPDRILETDLLRWLIVWEKGPAMLSMVQKNLSAEDFRVDICRRVFQAIEALAAAGERWNLWNLAAQAPEGQGLLDEIMQRKLDKDRGDQLVLAAIQKVLDRNWMLQTEEIGAKIRSGVCSDDEVLLLLKEFDTLKRNPPKVQS